ncbi:MAG: GerAB/ArcD/ProY family transporter [Bacillota bacterium]|nr:endospore germination permease [Bacillota bacterium]
MLEDGRISNRQAVFLIVSTILPTSIIYIPAIIYQEAAQDSWMSVLLVTAYGVIVGAIIAGLGLRFPDRTIVQYGELAVGRLLGKVVGLLYAVYFLYINTYIVREFAEFTTTAFLPETPLVVFSVGIVLAAAYAVRCGLEVLARANEIILPVVLVLILLLVALISPEMHIRNFTPVLEQGILPVLQGSYRPVAFLFTETIVMVMLIPYLSRSRQARGTIIRGILIVGLFQLIIVVAAIAVLGVRTARLEFPFLTIARQISIAEVIERVEPFVMLIWVVGGFMEVGVFYYCCVLAAAQWLNLKEYKALVLPTGVLLTVLSIVLWENVLELTRQISEILLPIAMAMHVGLPLLLLTAACLRGKGGGAR